MFQEQVFDNAGELWNAVGPSNPTLHARGDSLIFRGQLADSKMRLIPTALRDTDRSRILWTKTRGEPKADEQVFIEIQALQTFASYADAAGIRIPSDSLQFRKSLEAYHQYTTSPWSWPGDGFLECMALAQHHGVSTRLLDWTYNPYVALYFTASAGLSRLFEGEEQNTLMAVWIRDFRNSGVRIFHPLSAGYVSSRSSVQGSVFTVHPCTDNRGDTLTIEGLEEIIPFATSLKKWMLPIKWSPELIEMCEQIGISAATVYPGIDGVGKATQESLLRFIVTTPTP